MRHFKQVQIYMQINYNKSKTVVVNTVTL